MDRREFFKKAGLAGGLSAAGALTLKKEYVKPVVRMLEPSYAEALTPVLDVTLTQPAGSEVTARGGGLFTIGVWAIDVPLSAAIPANVAVSCVVDYTFQSSGANNNWGGIPGGSTSINLTGFQTSAGELRLAQTVGGAAVTNAVVDGQANAAGITTGNNITILSAMMELWTSTALTGGGNIAEANDAFLMGYTPTIAAASILGVNIPATPLERSQVLFRGREA